MYRKDVPKNKIHTFRTYYWDVTFRRPDCMSHMDIHMGRNKKKEMHVQGMVGCLGVRGVDGVGGVVECLRVRLEDGVWVWVVCG